MERRVIMPDEEFERLGEAEPRDEFRFYTIWERLIVENPDLQDVDAGDNAEAFTRGQLLLARIGTFHSQVCNGGIEQFFWNCPYFIFDLRDDLELLGSPEILAAYDRALESLVGREEDWATLRSRWEARDELDFAAFIESRELLDVDWFNDVFFGQWANGVQIVRGVGDEIARRTSDYVKQHRADFLRSAP